jgi:hypothetical protein
MERKDGVFMAFKPNYGQHRAERDRAKRAKLEEKLQVQRERTAQRKAASETPSADNQDDNQDEEM